MNDKELDDLMVTVLWDSMEDAAPCSEPFQPSRWHAAQMAQMKRNPLAWMRGKTRPVWRKLLNAAAAVLLVAAMSWGGLWLLAPEVHASFTSYLVQWSETHLTFLYLNEHSHQELPAYELTYVPEGYSLIHHVENPTVSTISIYQNASGEQLHFVYAYMFSSSVLSIDLMESTVTPVTINGCPGYYLDEPVPTNFDTLVWNDSGQNLQFVLVGCFDLDTLTEIAKGISLQKK